MPFALCSADCTLPGKMHNIGYVYHKCRDIAETLERFTAGEIDADGFLDDLRDMGIDVECTVDQLTLTSRYLVLPILMAEVSRSSHRYAGTSSGFALGSAGLDLNASKTSQAEQQQTFACPKKPQRLYRPLHTWTVIILIQRLSLICSMSSQRAPWKGNIGLSRVFVL